MFREKMYINKDSVKRIVKCRELANKHELIKRKKQAQKQYCDAKGIHYLEDTYGLIFNHTLEKEDREFIEQTDKQIESEFAIYRTSHKIFYKDGTEQTTFLKLKLI